MGTMQMKNQNIDWVQIALNQYYKRFIMKAGSDKGGSRLFDERSYALLKEITMYEYITKNEVMRKLNLSDRQFQYDLEKINNVLESLDYPQVFVENNVFSVDEKLKNITKYGLPLNINPNLLNISEQDRVFLIYLYTFIRKEEISNFHYQLLLGVSRNTALADVKRVRELCSKWDIEVVYTRAEGYHLAGDEYDKRILASYCIDTLLSQALGKEMLVLVLRKWQYDEYLVTTDQIVTDFLAENEIQLVNSRKNEMITRLAFIQARNKRDELLFKEYEKQIIERQSLYEQGEKLSVRLFGEDGKLESYYITIQLLISQQEGSRDENPALEDLAERIIENFEKITLLPIEDKGFLKQSLYNHLVPAFFRIAFKIPVVNPLTTRIKKEYRELFQFVKQALSPLSMWTGQKLSDEEIGFFTIHFGGYLEKNKRPKEEKLHALIACTNGISTSLMLKAQLNEMFPDILLSSIHTVGEIAEIPTSNYDLIFSTVEVASVKPVYIVKPLLSQIEKNYLFQAVASDFPRMDFKQVSVEEIMAVIRKYADIKEDEELYSELVNILYSQDKDKGRYAPMLSELLTTDMIQFTNEEIGWKDAIKQVSQPLLDIDKIETGYVDTMINNVDELGAYIHVGKGIAIPHARPEAGVKSLGMSFLRTTTPVLLLDKEEHAIDIFICIAAVDNEAHLKALAHLTKILGNNEKLQTLKDAKTAEEVIKIIKQGEDE